MRTDELHEKHSALQRTLEAYGSVAVAFSGGVDSSLLLFAAHDTLGENAQAITARMPLFPEREFDAAAQFCERFGIVQHHLDLDPLSHAEICSNPPNRCYHCKRLFMSQAQALAQNLGLSMLVEGSNVDDSRDFRPGAQAIEELGIESPLRQCGLSKREIRALSHEFSLPTWDKPSYACLASRFAYGDALTPQRLRMVDEAEQGMRSLGLSNVRVRVAISQTPSSGQDIYTARIEVDDESIAQLLQPTTRATVIETAKAAGFTYVTLDLEGYRTGSMNLAL